MTTYSTYWKKGQGSGIFGEGYDLWYEIGLVPVSTGCGLLCPLYLGFAPRWDRGLHNSVARNWGKYLEGREVSTQPLRTLDMWLLAVVGRWGTDKKGY